MIRRISILLLSLFCSVTIFAEQPKLVPHPIKLKNGKQFALNLPSNFDIIPAAEGLKRVRFFAKAPDGRIFVTDMHDLSDNQKARFIFWMTGMLKLENLAKSSLYDRAEKSNSVQFLY